MKEIESIVSRVFGKLTVIAFSHLDKGSYWVTKCECGNERIVSRKELIRGRVTHCGDQLHLIIDLKGQRFGRLLVIELAYVDRIEGAYWKCICDCGETKVTSSHRLLQGKTKSCGASIHHIRDLIGYRSGKLLVIKLDRITPDRAWWVCQCDCGNLHTVQGSNLTSATSIQSCGCVINSGSEARDITWDVDPVTGCWLCTSHVCSDVIYPTRTCNGVAERLSRKHYTEYKDVIPPGMLVCHRCDDPRCINPDHLFLGTAYDNRQDMINKGRQNNARGEQSGSAKLTEQQVREIYDNRYVCYKHTLAQQYNVSPSNIDHIWKGNTWKHVTQVPAVDVEYNTGLEWSSDTDILAQGYIKDI